VADDSIEVTLRLPLNIVEQAGRDAWALAFGVRGDYRQADAPAFRLIRERVGMHAEIVARSPETKDAILSLFRERLPGVIEDLAMDALRQLVREQLKVLRKTGALGELVQRELAAAIEEERRG